MHITLPVSLEPQKSYTQFGTLFSKTLILQHTLTQHKKIILIVENDKCIRQYIKHFDYLHMPYSLLESENDLAHIMHDKQWLFIINNFHSPEMVISQKQLTYKCLTLTVQEEREINDIIKSLTQLWYTHSDFGIPGSYRKLWDTVNITDFNKHCQYTISFWWEYIESITILNIDNDFQTSSNTQSITLWSNTSIYNSQEKTQESLITLLTNSNALMVLDQLDFSENYYEYKRLTSDLCSFDFIGNKENSTICDLNITVPEISSIDDFKTLLSEKNKHIHIYTKNTKTITNFLEYNNLSLESLHEITWAFIKSFVHSNEGTQTYVLSDDMIWELFIKKRAHKNMSVELDLLLKIHPGDYVVHIDHWIGIFKGIIKKELPHANGKATLVKEYIEIAYKWEDKLFVPITEVGRVNKFVWWDNPKLTWLNTTEWQRKLKKVDESVQIIAEELLEVYSQRKLSSSFSFVSDHTLEAKFQNSFPYQYTPDQSEAINEILSDMESSMPMDRLLVWDVWFGKTEVAFNAIYRALINKKQVIFIAPLVVLAYEHYEKAVDRFRWYGFKIGLLTRMESKKNIENTLTWLREWSIDLVIGTHKLLQDNIIYKNLWLLVVDEEHKFGVNDKEKIKKLQTSIDILSMSATPIPRSLNMALSQIKQISVIKTPPPWRKSIKTLVSKYSEKVIFDACTNEFAHGWQVYFVHNRVQSLTFFEKTLKTLFPDKKIIITHGQLPWDTLEKRIIDFKHKKYDILLTTTVIENGIDFPNVNTIFVNEAQNFGISQIHQLRWRVGRSEKQGHCYLLYKNENLGTETAKRLQTLVNYSYLWAWFELAMKDLEVRGWWDLLWIKQSGQSSEIWVNLYLRLIEQKIQELKTNKEAATLSTNTEQKGNTHTSIWTPIYTKIDIPMNVWIPNEYFESDLDKINFYREIESITEISDLDTIKENFITSNNIENIPEDMHQLFLVLALRIYAAQKYITHIKKSGNSYQIDFHEKTSLNIVKDFLKYDKKVYFIVVNAIKLRTPIKHFTNEEKFLEYLVNLLNKKVKNTKIRLKK